MKLFRIITVLLLVVGATLAVQAQVVRKTDKDDPKKKAASQHITERQQSFYEVKEPSDADLQWMKIVYRELDLTKGKNPALYYPEEPNEDGQSMFYIIMRLVAAGDINCYEWLDGREMFTDEYRYKVTNMFDRFHILYTQAKGSTEKNPHYSIENADIPGSEVLSYYVIEKWEFDTRSNQMRSRIEALCPVLHREDEYGVMQKWPMFWVKLNDIRPYIAQQYVFTDDDNNLLRYNLDDFFKLNMYSGEIYKVKNLRNLTLRQQFPEDAAYKHAQDSIENRLRQFDKNLWVPSREELQARAQAKKDAEMAATAGDSDVAESTPTADNDKKTTTGVKRSSKRSKLSSTKREKERTPKVKTRKPKSTGSSGAARSVRNRKR